jgi:hypothetical protein
MFSAIYLVCMTGQPCQFFVDTMPYPSEEVCEKEAMNNIARNMNRVLLGEIPPFVAEHQCLSWIKA